MKIILDFDDTIFNTHWLFNAFLSVFRKADFSKKEFLDSYQKTKEETGYLNLRTVFDLLACQSKSSDKEKIKKETEFIVNRMNRLVYPDFFDFARHFNKNDLILFSYGDAGFQNEKIEKSKIIPFFNEIIITSDDKTKNFEAISRKYHSEKIFFIEDSVKQVDRVKKEFPLIIALNMKRPQGKHIKEKSELADYVVKDFYEAKNIILKF